MTVVPFTWREDQPTERVYLHVTGVHSHHDRRLHQMRRASDGWWRTEVDVPDDACCSYRIIPVTAEVVARHDPPEGDLDTRARWRALVGHTVPDPLTRTGTAPHPAIRPAHFTDDSGRLIMPRALPAPGWVDADIPAWAEDEIGGRRVFLGGEANGEYLLVLFDGVKWTRTALPATLRRLHAQGVLPTVRILAVDTAEDRFALLGRGQELRDHVRRDLLPWAATDSHPRPADRIIVCGQSLGGLAAVDLVAHMPQEVALAISNSGSFWFPAWGGEPGGELGAELRNPRHAAKLRDAGVRVHLSVGLAEGGMVEHSRAVGDILHAGGVPVSVEVSNHAHEMTGWVGALTRGLTTLIGGSEGSSARTSSTVSVEAEAANAGVMRTVRTLRKGKAVSDSRIPLRGD